MTLGRIVQSCALIEETSEGHLNPVCDPFALFNDYMRIILTDWVLIPLEKILGTPVSIIYVLVYIPLIVCFK